MAKSKETRESRAAALATEVAGGQTLQQAARKLGISLRTAQRLAGLPEFNAQVRAIRKQVVGRAVAILGQVAVKAAVKLNDLLDNKDPEVQLKAAALVLKSTVDLGDYESLADRVDEIEAKLADGPGPTPWG